MWAASSRRHPWPVVGDLTSAPSATRSTTTLVSSGRRVGADVAEQVSTTCRRLAASPTNPRRAGGLERDRPLWPTALAPDGVERERPRGSSRRQRQAAGARRASRARGGLHELIHPVGLVADAAHEALESTLVLRRGTNHGPEPARPVGGDRGDRRAQLGADAVGGTNAGGAASGLLQPGARRRDARRKAASILASMTFSVSARRPTSVVSLAPGCAPVRLLRHGLGGFLPSRAGVEGESTNQSPKSRPARPAAPLATARISRSRWSVVDGWCRGAGRRRGRPPSCSTEARTRNSGPPDWVGWRVEVRDQLAGCAPGCSRDHPWEVRRVVHAVDVRRTALVAERPCQPPCGSRRTAPRGPVPGAFSRAVAVRDREARDVPPLSTHPSIPDVGLLELLVDALVEKDFQLWSR